MAVFYDTHAHLDYPELQEELPEVISRALKAAITKIVAIGTDGESSRRAIHISEQFPNVFAVVGWHPSESGTAPEDVRPQLRELATHPKVVALGETGLDYYRLPSRTSGTSAEDEIVKTKQKKLFQQHLEVAGELRLNCVIHQRESLEDTIAVLEPFAAKVRGVFHCFSSEPAAMRRILALNSIISFTGILTFKNAQIIRQTLAETPFGSFMLETDSPYLAPVPYRGKRCEPAYVREIAELAANVKGCSLDELSSATCGTAEAFFRNIG
jgi:TatD DNase family protein